MYAYTDSVAMSHSNCLRLLYYDKDHKSVMNSILCDSSYNFFGSFDSSLLGRRWDFYNDTNMRTVFEIESYRGTVVGCFRYFFDSSSKVAYKEGYRAGEAIRISYQYDEYGNKRKETVQTAKETIEKAY